MTQHYKLKAFARWEVKPGMEETMEKRGRIYINHEDFEGYTNQVEFDPGCPQIRIYGDFRQDNGVTFQEICVLLEEEPTEEMAMEEIIDLPWQTVVVLAEKEEK